jgi:hypothetical protein
MSTPKQTAPAPLPPHAIVFLTAPGTNPDIKVAVECLNGEYYLTAEHNSWTFEASADGEHADIFNSEHSIGGGGGGMGHGWADALVDLQELLADPRVATLIQDHTIRAQVARGRKAAA